MKLEKAFYEIPTKESFQKIILRNKDESSFLNPYEGGFDFCVVTIPTRLLRFTLEEFSENDFIVPLKKVKTHYKLIRRTTNKKPVNLSTNQIYLEPENYNLLCQSISGGEAHGAYLMVEIKNKLTDIGYDLEDDDWGMSKTIIALKDFQKKNKLVSGILDEKTMNVLNIESRN